MGAHAFADAFESIDTRGPRLRAAVAVHLADALACLDAAARTSEGMAIAAFYARASESATPSPMAEASCAAALIRFTEWDAVHVPSCVTPGAVAVPVALALTSNADRLIAAIQAGYAVGLALAEAAGGVAALTKGVWPTLLAAPAIAAASAAVSLGLTREQTAHALAIALAGASGRSGRATGSPSSRWLAVGEATLKGMRAAVAARSGFRGDVALLSPAWLEGQSDPAVVRPSSLETLPGEAVSAVGIKPFVAARQGINALEAVRQILAAGVRDGAIDEIKVTLPAEVVPVVTRPLDLTDRLSTIAHLGLQTAIAALEPTRLTDVGRDRPFDARIVSLAGRVEVSAAARTDSEPGSWPATVAILASGRWTEHTCRRVPGDRGDEEAAFALVEAKVASLPDRSAERLRRVLSDFATGRGAPIRDAAEAMQESLSTARAGVPFLQCARSPQR